MSKKLQYITLFLSIIGLIVLSGCNAVDAITGKDDDNDDTLHPILLNEKWGYINNSGNIAIEPRYDEAREFSDGYAAVRIGTNWGYVSEDTKRLEIPATLSVAGDFSGNLAPAQRPGELYGFINTAGEFAISPQYDFAGAFSEGLAAVRLDGLWGYVSTGGEVAVELSFSDARAFSENRAAVETFEGWVYVDRSGTEVINPNFQITDAGEFNEGLAPIQTTEGWGYIDLNGNPVITPSFDDAGIFSQGLAWVQEGDYIGFISKDGQMAISPQFAEVKSFKENLSAVRLSSDWYYISRNNGTIVIKDPFDEAESFRNGIARVRLGGENPRYGYVAKDGEYVWYPTR